MEFFATSVRRLPILLLALLLSSLAAVAQPVDTTGLDTTNVRMPDSAVVRVGNRSGVDTSIVYSARDSSVLSIDQKKLRLYGDASVTNGRMKLTAAYIEVDFTTSELYASAHYDSVTRKYSGEPVFKDATQEFSALSMRYNFKTGKGVTEAAETAFDDGFYYGEKIKRVDQNTLFIKDGVYTTCDAPHPHYFFRSERMKVAVNDKVYADQPTLNVADVPIFFIPIGIFFAKRGGRQSGIIIPRWSPDAQRGFTIEGLGYFWAGNEYLDATLLTNLYSKAGYTVNPIIRAQVNGYLEGGRIDYHLGKTRTDPDEPITTSHVISINATAGQRLIGRHSSLGGNLQFSTENGIRAITTNSDRFNRLNDVTTSLINSNFSFTTFDGALTANYSRNQNIVTNELTQNIPISFVLPTITPFAPSSGAEGGFFSSLSLGYSGGVQTEIVRQRPDSTVPEGFRLIDTRRAVTHTPSIRFTPKLGYFSVQPSITYRENWFFRRTVYQPNGALVDTATIPGFYRVWWWSANLGISTTLYGIVQPRVLGINALRHTISPTITFGYQPDFGTSKFGYYDEYFNPVNNRIERYSIFNADASVGSVPSAGLAQTISINIANSFEAKIAQGDTLPDLKVRLLSLSLGTGYNAAAPGNYRWQSIYMNASTELGSIGTLSGNATFDPYATDERGQRIPELLIKRGEGLARVTYASLSVSMGISNQGFGTSTPSISAGDSVAARRGRFDFDRIDFDGGEFFGDDVSGAGDFRIPWEIRPRLSYNITRLANSNDFSKYFDVGMDISFSLTPTTRVSSRLQYNVVDKAIVVPSISFFKDLHCWEMEFNWTPTGYARGFHFRLGIKSPQLQDIELERDRYE